MSQANLRLREVFFYWFEGDGDDLPGEQIYFITSDDIGYTEENFIAQRKVYATHDSGARYKAMLWCDQDSLVTIDWKVQFPKDPNDEKAELPKPKSFSLTYGPGTSIGLGILLALTRTPDTPTELVYQAVYAYILALIADGTIPSSGETLENFISARTLRYDQSQTLTDGQKAQARTNLGVTSNPGGGGSVEKDYIDITAAPYSAIPDGSDSTDALHSAIAAAKASSSKKRIYIPGRFTFQGEIDLQNAESITLFGDGARIEPTDSVEPHALIYTGTEDRFIKAGRSQGLTISGLGIRNSNTAFTGHLIDLMPLGSGSGVTYKPLIEGCAIGGLSAAARHAKSGIHTAGVVECLINDTNFCWSDFGVLGVIAGDSVPFATVVHISGFCRFVKLGTYAIGNPGQQWVIERNTFEFLYSPTANENGKAGGIATNQLGGGGAGDGLVIRDNGFWDVAPNAGGDWLHLFGNALVVEGNFFSLGNSATGLHLFQGGSGATVRGNRVLGTNGAIWINNNGAAFYNFFDDGSNTLDGGITKYNVPSYLIPTSLSAGEAKITHQIVGGAVSGADAANCPGAGNGYIMGGSQRDAAGSVQITTGSNPTGSDKVFFVNFGTNYPNPPIAVLLTPANAATAALSGNAAVYVSTADITANGFTARVGSTPLAAGMQYRWFYQVIGQ